MKLSVTEPSVLFNVKFDYDNSMYQIFSLFETKEIIVSNGINIIKTTLEKSTKRFSFSLVEFNHSFQLVT